MNKVKRPPTSISYTHAQSGLCNDKDKDKRSPAYKGAKFDARGFCLHHEDVRLCRVISHGKFNIVRKICYRCGSSSLVRDKKKTKKLHAQKKKSKSPHPQEEVSSNLVSASTSDRDSGRVNSNEVHRPNHRQTQQATIKCSRERRRKTVTDTHTTSPIQKTAPVLPRRPLSSSEVLKPKLITAKKIDELRNMMPPPLYQARSNEDAPKKKETHLPFDKHGCCRLHPARKLAEKNQDGGWNIVAGVCPDCCVNAVLQLDLDSKQKQSLVPTKKSHAKKNDSGKDEELIGKVVRVSSDESQHTYPTANSSISVASYYSGSNLSSPDSVTKPSLAFFTQNNKFAGLKISQEGGDVERTLNTSGLSEEATHKFKNRLPDPPTLPLFQG